MVSLFVVMRITLLLITFLFPAFIFAHTSDACREALKASLKPQLAHFVKEAHQELEKFWKSQAETHVSNTASIYTLSFGRWFAQRYITKIRQPALFVHHSTATGRPLIQGSHEGAEQYAIRYTLMGYRNANATDETDEDVYEAEKKQEEEANKRAVFAVKAAINKYKKFRDTIKKLIERKYSLLVQTAALEIQKAKNVALNAMVLPYIEDDELKFRDYKVANSVSLEVGILDRKKAYQKLVGHWQIGLLPHWVVGEIEQRRYEQAWLRGFLEIIRDRLKTYQLAENDHKLEEDQEKTLVEIETLLSNSELNPETKYFKQLQRRLLYAELKGLEDNENVQKTMDLLDQEYLPSTFWRSLKRYTIGAFAVVLVSTATRYFIGRDIWTNPMDMIQDGVNHFLPHDFVLGDIERKRRPINVVEDAEIDHIVKQHFLKEYSRTMTNPDYRPVDPSKNDLLDHAIKELIDIAAAKHKAEIERERDEKFRKRFRELNITTERETYKALTAAIQNPLELATELKRYFKKYFPRDYEQVTSHLEQWAQAKDVSTRKAIQKNMDMISSAPAAELQDLLDLQLKLVQVRNSGGDVNLEIKRIVTERVKAQDPTK